MFLMRRDNLRLREDLTEQDEEDEMAAPPRTDAKGQSHWVTIRPSKVKKMGWLLHQELPVEFTQIIN